MEKLLRDKKMILLFVGPAALLLICILMGPMIYGIALSLFQWDGMAPPKFIGIDNFTFMFTQDVTFWVSFKNSIFFVIFSLISQQFLGLLTAIILTNNIKFKNLFKNIYYLPVVLSSAAVGLLWSFIFHPKIGVLNQLLLAIGVEGPKWLSEISGFLPLPLWCIGIVAAWQYMGSTMMLYMAAIQGIPESLYEAAYIDGASRIKCIRYITLPLITPMVKISTVLSCIGSLKFFDLIYTMTKGGPAHATEVLASHLYTRSFTQWEYGYGSALAIILVILCLLFTFVLNKLVKVENYEM